MKNNLKVIGFIAVVAVIAMGIVGCGPAPEEVNIIEPDLGFIVGETLKVDAVGDTEWYTGDNANTPVSKGPTFTPTAAGRYYAKVGGTQSNNYAIVFEIPTTTPTSRFKMVGADNGTYKVGTSGTSDEIVEIAKDSFTLTGYNGGTTTKNGDELSFTITRWEQVDPNADAKADYPIGLKLTILNPEQKIPGGIAFYTDNPTPTNMYIYINSGYTKFIRTRPGSTNYAPKGGFSTADAVVSHARYYVKQ